MAGDRPRPLHSLVDPRREGFRLISTLDREDFLIFLGMGGAYHIEAALERPETAQVIIVEFGLRGLAELFGLRDLHRVLGDSRVRILADPPPGGLERFILACFLPALSGAVKVLPLRPRVEESPEAFAAAAEEIRGALGRISADYSVQAHFGIRMFKNILRNILIAGRAAEESAPLPRIKRALVCAAGPSLDGQVSRIAESRERGGFLIAADTSLPALLNAGLEPDAVVSIDCQHISYRHLMPPKTWVPSENPEGVRHAGPSPLGGAILPPAVPLFLDLASPLASLAGRRIFFSGGHPLAEYVSARWRPFPAIDSSGGNVTYAAVSLAEFLGAREIELYGADFSYPLGRTYARGTYIFPFFNIRQNRLCPLEALFSNFLYRSPLEKRISPQVRGPSWYYETETLIRYREALEAKGGRMKAQLLPAAGLGAPIKVPGRGNGVLPAAAGLTGSGIPARDFLAEYREKIRSLPPLRGAGDYPAELNTEGRMVLATLLPLAAALRRRDPGLGGAETIEETRNYGVAAIDRILG
jgi:hypothetical protein